MNLLTGKAKEDFFYWFRENKRDLRKSYLDDTCDNALIIEWLDSVGIYIQVVAISTHGQPIFDYNIQQDNEINGMNGYTFSTRLEATTEAIKQSNIIYNEN